MSERSRDEEKQNNVIHSVFFTKVTTVTTVPSFQLLLFKRCAGQHNMPNNQRLSAAKDSPIFDM